jgi:hypothetical protein
LLDIFEQHSTAKELKLGFSKFKEYYPYFLGENIGFSSTFPQWSLTVGYGIATKKIINQLRPTLQTLFVTRFDIKVSKNDIRLSESSVSQNLLVYHHFSQLFSQLFDGQNWG